MSAARHATAGLRGIGARGRRAFTIVELMVVIVVITILIGIAVPMFRAMVSSSESALAEGLLGAALKGARDAAVGSTGDADAALGFFFEPGGRLTMVPYLKAGEIDDRIPGTGRLRRDVFVPAPGAEATVLPQGWMVRGLAPPGSIDATWYEAGTGGARYAPGEPNWVFPETGFYLGSVWSTQVEALGSDVNQDGAHRQSFVVRFKAGTGEMVTSGRDVMLVAPRPSPLLREDAPWSTHRPDQSPSLQRWVRLVLTDRDSAMLADKMVGDTATDSVLARPVAQVVLYEEAELAAALGQYGARLDRQTGSLYRAPDPAVPATHNPELVPASVAPDELSRRARQWIEGDTNFDGVLDRGAFQGAPDARRGDRPSARIFMVDRYLATARPIQTEVQP